VNSPCSVVSRERLREETMKRPVLRLAAVIGAATVSALAVSPAFAAATVSQAKAQSLQLSIGGQSAISQEITATNEGGAESRTNTSTIPVIADLLTGNNVVQAGVAPQDAHANALGDSYACAGIAGDQSGGVVTVGKSSCSIDGADLSLGLGTLDLDLVHIFGTEGALTSQLNTALQPLTGPLGSALDDAVSQLTSGLDDTPLGQIGLAGHVSAIEATCTANPAAAAGDAQILDTAGRHTLPISVTIPDGSGSEQTVNLVDLNANLAPRPGGWDLFINLDDVSQALIDALDGELDVALNGAIADSGLADPIKLILQTAQDDIVNSLVDGLRDPLLQQLSDNVLKVTINDRTFGDSGKSVAVTALDAEVLPAARQFANASLISGVIGHVTCGPNQAPAAETSGTQTCAKLPCGHLPDIPTVVDSGMAGHADHTARNVLGATAALMLLAGTAGLAGYRRMLNK
jgi:hypothetical protein